MSELKFLFNFEKTYVNSNLLEELKPKLNYDFIYDTDDLLVYKNELDFTFMISDDGKVTINANFIGSELKPLVEQVFNSYLDLTNKNDKYEFPYIFKCLSPQEEDIKDAFTNSDMQVKYTNLELSQSYCFTIYLKGTL